MLVHFSATKAETAIEKLREKINLMGKVGIQRSSLPCQAGAPDTTCYFAFIKMILADFAD